MNRPLRSAPLRAADAAPVALGTLRGESRDELLREEVLADLFRATATARPDHTALIFADERWSYAALDARTDAIARGLIQRGIGPGDVVGLWMARSAELLIAQIAITKSGAAWLPFDAEAPVERIAVCLADAQAKALLTAGCLTQKADVGCPVLTSEALAKATQAGPVDPGLRGLTPDDPAYMIYTSGST